MMLILLNGRGILNLSQLLLKVQVIEGLHSIKMSGSLLFCASFMTPFCKTKAGPREPSPTRHNCLFVDKTVRDCFIREIGDL